MGTRFLYWGAVWVALAASHAFAAEARPEQEKPAPQGLTGDWGGARSWLFSHGVELNLGYVAEGAYNAAGGRGHALRQAGQLAVDAGFDLGKLFGLEGGTFKAIVTWRNGRNLGADMDLGTLQLVQEVYGRGHVVRLTDLWYAQKFSGGLLELKLGRLTVGEDFASFACEFQNLTFCGSQPGNIVGNYWFNWPVSQWGARFKLDWHHTFYAEVAAYEVNPRNLEEAFYFSRLPGATGALIPLEAGWLPKLGAKELPGSYKIGVWYDTSHADDVLLDQELQPQVLTGGPPLRRQGRYGIYVNLQQQLTGARDGSEPALSLFLNASQADTRTATTDNQVSIGLIFAGFLESRHGDQVALAFGRTHVNSRVAEGQRLQNSAAPGSVPVQEAEYAAELDYNLQATKWLVVRPNLQYIHLPGGTSDNPEAVVIGLKVALKL